ncbi:response regulator transcription factor [Duganella sp. BJB1802]|uniref:response regulator n=1 Tax=Duganella sp. BJB1802 TaxID=2744575 RepID=UPI001593CAF8|nr:response regulator transcription factor [Duganella sp. BJB1802]NVD74937.1 response regulator transcription factor [Duganella sp. BJB1802]
MKILLIENDLDLGDEIRIALVDQGMDVVWVRMLGDANRFLDAGTCDLVLLDLNLPDGDGRQLLRRLRRSDSGLPVLTVSAQDSLPERLRAFDSGADDYLAKPFDLAELVLRLLALVRRSYGFDGKRLGLRDLSLHVPTRRASLRGRPVKLTACEFVLLKTLLIRANRVVTRRSLEEQALPGARANSSNSLDVHIANLRRKIGEGYIETVRGIGYVIVQGESVA